MLHKRRQEIDIMADASDFVAVERVDLGIDRPLRGSRHAVTSLAIIGS